MDPTEESPGEIAGKIEHLLGRRETAKSKNSGASAKSKCAAKPEQQADGKRIPDMEIHPQAACTAKTPPNTRRPKLSIKTPLTIRRIRIRNEKWSLYNEAEGQQRKYEEGRKNEYGAQNALRLESDVTTADRSTMDNWYWDAFLFLRHLCTPEDCVRRVLERMGRLFRRKHPNSRALKSAGV